MLKEFSEDSGENVGVTELREQGKTGYLPNNRQLQFYISLQGKRQIKKSTV